MINTLYTFYTMLNTIYPHLHPCSTLHTPTPCWTPSTHIYILLNTIYTMLNTIYTHLHPPCWTPSTQESTGRFSSCIHLTYTSSPPTPGALHTCPLLFPGLRDNSTVTAFSPALFQEYEHYIHLFYASRRPKGEKKAPINSGKQDWNIAYILFNILYLIFTPICLAFTPVSLIFTYLFSFSLSLLSCFSHFSTPITSLSSSLFLFLMWHSLYLPSTSFPPPIPSPPRSSAHPTPSHSNCPTLT